jgi:RIO kinase 2
MIGGRSTNVEAITRMSGQPIERVTFALDELNKKALIGFSGENYVVYTSALDLLALKHYADLDYAQSLGKVIAKGKESDVYEVLSATGNLYALKFFRLGRTSFRDVRRKRYASQQETHRWVTDNFMAAKREFEGLQRLSGLTTRVPTPVAYTRHTVLMGELSGVRLSNRLELVSPEKALRKIMETMRDAYTKGGMIHGDMSEYNVLTDGKEVWLIDWPQWVSSRHPNAGDLLRRDVSTLVRFFARVYRVSCDLEEVLSYVRGEARSFRVRRARSSSRGSAS